MTRFSVFFTVLAVTIAGCENSGSRHSAGDSGLLPDDTSTVGPKADWDNNDDGSTDGTINTDGSESPDASSDGQDVVDVTDVNEVLDCSTPPVDCGLTEGQALICSGISKSPVHIWVFWNSEGCEWNMYGDDWPDEHGVIGSVPALEPESMLEVLECVDAPVQ